MLLKISFIAYIIYLCIQDGWIFSFYGSVIKDLPEWLYKPLGGCPYCFSGQVLFWYYLFQMDSYNLIDHAFFGAFGVGMAFVWHSIYLTLDNHITKLE